MKKYLIIFIYSICSWSVSAQDLHFSMNDINPLYLNPAQAGMNVNLRGSLHYREQWRSVSTPFTTGLFSFDVNTMKNTRGNATLGVGLQLMNDRAGDSRMGMTQGNLNLSAVLKLAEESKLSFGLMGGLGQRSIDYSSLRWESQYINGAYDQGNSSGENFSGVSTTFFDAGAGIVWSYGKDQGYITQNNGLKFNFGLSAFHFNLPNAQFLGGSDEKIKTKVVGFVNAEIGKENSNLTFIPSVYYSRQGNLQNLMIGNTFRYLISEGSHFTGFVKSSAISFGLNYRLKDAFIGNFNIEYANYTVGFSYDLTISSLSSVNRSRGAFEIALRFKTPNPFGQVSRARI
jgi:type IX secretion system PorP/SprF family membrane protein